MADLTPTKKAPASPQQEQETQDYLLFEGALQTAYKEELLKWDGEGDQQAFIKKLKMNTVAKAKFNRRCKRILGIKYVNEKPGNQRQLQGAHPRQVAVGVAADVYDTSLQYYKKNGHLPMYSYQKLKVQLDQAIQERDRARQERDRAIEELNLLKSIKTMEMPEVKEALPTVGKAKEEGNRVKDEEGAVSEQKVKVEK